MKSKTLLIIIMALLVIGSLATAGYFYWQYQQTQTQLKNPNQAAQQETQGLIDQMSKIIDLPASDIKNGEPTLATVLDKSKLKDQPFFDNAQNGDKVLIYTKAKKAYLFRPSTGKVINVAPVTIGAGQEVKVAIRNGSTNSSLTNKVSDELKAAYPNVTVTGTDTAKTTNYTKTIVVDLSGSNATAASSIATSLKGQVGSLPTGESKPDGADFLVIVGSDQQ